MAADVIAAPRRLALIAAASFLVPMSLAVLAYGAFAWRVSLQAAKEMTPEPPAARGPLSPGSRHVVRWPLPAAVQVQELVGGMAIKPAQPEHNTRREL